jgi:Tfp pilus assembly protein PilV
MKSAPPSLTHRRGALGYTLAEVLIAVFLVAIMGITLYAGFTAGFSSVKLARENLRATQILLKRTEGIRLYSWSQVTNNSYLSPTFVAFYDPQGQTNQTSGAVYVGKVDRTVPTGLPAAYQNNMRAITVSIYWTNYNGSKQIVRSRQIQTYVARYGMQNYIYGSLK